MASRFPATPTPAAQARRAGPDALREAGASVRTIVIDDETLKIRLVDPEVDNERDA